MTDERYRDPEWLRKKYVDEGLLIKEIAEMCGVSTGAINRWLKGYKIPKRSNTRGKKSDNL